MISVVIFLLFLLVVDNIHFFGLHMGIYSSNLFSEISTPSLIDSRPIFTREKPSCPLLSHKGQQKSQKRDSTPTTNQTVSGELYGILVDFYTRSSYNPDFLLDKRGFKLNGNAKETIRKALEHLAVIPDKDGNIIDNYATDRMDEIYELLEDNILSPAMDYFTAKQTELETRQRIHELTIGGLAILRQCLPTL